MKSTAPTVLIILDGWGHREDAEDNAITRANTPIWDELWQRQPHCLISGSGLDVGLPAGQMGNSEVGHMNLGAGRVIHQDLTRISQAVTTGGFTKNAVLSNTLSDLAESGKALHLFGLLSPGGVHAHVDHISAMINDAKQAGVSSVFVHAFLDGRDVPPKSAEPSLASVDAQLRTDGLGGVASIIGRYYAMDRDNRWDRIEKAYNLVVDAESENTYDDPITALEAAYDRGETDEFVAASAIKVNGRTVTMADEDAIIFMNFRADRARQLSRAFTQQGFSAFQRQRTPAISHFVTLTEYAADIPSEVAYTPEKITNSLGEYLASLGKTQLRLAETEKYAHVTFFFSGGRETPFPDETRILIPSPDVATYDLQPEMSAPEVTDAMVDAITSGNYDLIVCNYANGDMVGHTGNFEASVKAVQTLDKSLGRIREALLSVGGQCLITADHGNVEQLVDHSTNQAHTAHTSELVPLVYLGPQAVTLKSEGGVLSDVAPTLLALMGLPQPTQMTGHSLLQTTAKAVSHS